MGGSHIYSKPGAYLVTLKVTDDDTGKSTSTWQVVVGDLVGALEDYSTATSRPCQHQRSTRCRTAWR